ncbi:unnamed protein product [Phytophthora fragariaefolia]|uniref:Unnamed protein product n=1 Tax=Phytophthora fragariaefolia TaxID=1490495 RepID=A0A9W6XD54_9STRA|nr:unnamed protein product [Phytophthora fragariaefolia]
MSYQQLYEVLASNSYMNIVGCKKKTVYPVADRMKVEVDFHQPIRTAKSISPANQVPGFRIKFAQPDTLQQHHSKHVPRYDAAQLDCELYNRNRFNTVRPQRGVSVPGRIPTPQLPPVQGEPSSVSAPSPLPPASTGDASGVDSEPSVAQPDEALSPVLGAVPRSAADAPEAASSAGSADSQPQGSVSGSGAPGDGACSAADAPEASFAAPGAPRFSSVRWEDVEDIVTAGTDRTVRQVQKSAQRHFLALARLVVDLNRRPPLRTDHELDQHPEAAGLLSDVVDALAPFPRLPAPWEYELTGFRDDVASLEARLAASEASRRREVDLRLKAERLCNQASHERNAALDNLRRIRLDRADAVRQLVATNIAVEQSSQAAAALEQRCRRLDKSLADTHKVIRQDREQFKAGISSYAAQLRQLREYLEQSDRQSSASCEASSASASAMPAAFATVLEELGALQLAIPPPPAASGLRKALDRHLWLLQGHLVELLLRQEAAAWSTFSGFEGSEKAAKQATSAAISRSGPSQSVPSSLPAASVPISSAPISGIAVSDDSDVLSYASIPSGSDPPFSPIPRTPASPASSTASTASLPSTPVVSRGITPGTEASVPVEIDDDGVANTHTGSVPPARVVATPTPQQASASRARTVVTATLSTIPGTRSTAFEPVTAIPAPIQGPQPRVRASRKLPDLANPLLEPASTAPGAQEAWCEILNARISQPIAGDRVTECSVADIQAFADWEDPTHPWQRLWTRLPESPCAVGADDFMPDKPISIRASGLAIVVKLWRQFTGRAVGRTEHSDLKFALWELAHWSSVDAVEQWP